MTDELVQSCSEILMTDWAQERKDATVFARDNKEAFEAFQAGFWAGYRSDTNHKWNPAHGDVSMKRMFWENDKDELFPKEDES